MLRSVHSAVASLAVLALLLTTVRGGTIQSYQATGNLSMGVSGYSNPAGAMSVLAGTLSVASVPLGATVQKAFVYAGDWNNSGIPLELSFNSSPGFSALPINSDAAFSTLYGYRWDVTSLVLGVPMSYNFSIGASGSP